MTEGTRPHTLIVGRSALPLTEAVAMLRTRGYGANATNQFDRVLDDYDASDLDLVIYGELRRAITRHPRHHDPG